METTNTDWAELCALCSAELKEMVMHPDRAQWMKEGFLFRYCPHNLVHGAWVDGQTTTQCCSSESYGELINGGFVASKRHFDKLAADLIASAVGNLGKSS
jgi:hypothetical protein